MKELKTEEALGQVLCHDITRIIQGVTKDTVFQKGHVITEEDIPVLLSVGKDHIYIWEQDETMLHENDAAQILYRICKGENMHGTVPKEGKIELISDCNGVLLVDSEKIKEVNSFGDLVIATRHGGFPVKKGEKLAGTRIIPLVMKKEKLDQIVARVGDTPLLQVVPFKRKKCGVITTGNEVFYGRIQDTFTPVIEEKLREYGGTVKSHILVEDDPEKITKVIEQMLKEGIEIVICTGGMSVDPDDKTPLAIKNAGVEIVSYGAPVLPGSMFLLAYTCEQRPVLGLPGCVMYGKRTIFDLVLPRLMADVVISKKQLEEYGEGGMCQDCVTCTFPNCGFGK